MVVARRASSPLAVTALVVANLLPLAGVLWWGWTVFEILLLYWVESGVVGAFNVPKILLAAGEEPNDGSAWTWQVDGLSSERLDEAGGLAAAAFFVAHYGVFWVVHGTFVFVLPLFAFAGPGGGFGGGPFGESPVGGGSGGVPGWGWETTPTVFLLAAGSLVLSHGVSFVTNYLRRGEYRTVSPTEQMMRPYGRVMVLHLTIVFGAFLIAALGSPFPALVLLVALKSALDLGAHLRDHRRAGERTGVP